MKRDPIAEILRYNRGFDAESLRRKIDAMGNSPFEFFRATSHLFALDARADSGPRGPIVGDLHSENFGAYRAVDGEIVYDINDFDDFCEAGPYQYDLRRLLTSLVVGGEQAKLPLTACVAACEAAMDEYLSALGRFAKARRREDFDKLEPAPAVKRLLSVAGEQSRAAMLKELVVAEGGGFRFRENREKFAPLDEKARAAVARALPEFVARCAAPAGASRSSYELEDAVFRYARKGSLGRRRYAVLLRKDRDRKGRADLRLIEWKESFNSPLDADKAGRREQSKGRAERLLDASLRFQLRPKRYLGFTRVSGRPFQCREIGANDQRFSPKQYADPARLAKAARVFGGIAARAHLLASLGRDGPRPMAGGKIARGLIGFALQYADISRLDFETFQARQGEIRNAWGHPGTL